MEFYEKYFDIQFARKIALITTVIFGLLGSVASYLILYILQGIVIAQKEIVPEVASYHPILCLLIGFLFFLYIFLVFLSCYGFWISIDALWFKRKNVERNEWIHEEFHNRMSAKVK